MQKNRTTTCGVSSFILILFLVVSCSDPTDFLTGNEGGMDNLSPDLRSLLEYEKLSFREKFGYIDDYFVFSPEPQWDHPQIVRFNEENANIFIRCENNEHTDIENNLVLIIAKRGQRYFSYVKMLPAGGKASGHLTAYRRGTGVALEMYDRQENGVLSTKKIGEVTINTNASQTRANETFRCWNEIHHTTIGIKRVGSGDSQTWVPVTRSDMVLVCDGDPTEFNPGGPSTPGGIPPYTPPSFGSGNSDNNGYYNNGTHSYHVCFVYGYGSGANFSYGGGNYGYDATVSPLPGSGNGGGSGGGGGGGGINLNDTIHYPYKDEGIYVMVSDEEYGLNPDYPAYDFVFPEGDDPGGIDFLPGNEPPPIPDDIFSERDELKPWPHVYKTFQFALNLDAATQSDFLNKLNTFLGDLDEGKYGKAYKSLYDYVSGECGIGLRFKTMQSGEAQYVPRIRCVNFQPGNIEKFFDYQVVEELFHGGQHRYYEDSRRVDIGTMTEGKKGFTNVELEAKVFKYSLFLNLLMDVQKFISVQDLLDENTEKGIRDDFRNTIMKMPSRQLSDTEYADILEKYTLYSFPPGYRKYPDGTFTNFHFYYYLLNNGQQ